MKREKYQLDVYASPWWYKTQKLHLQHSMEVIISRPNIRFGSNKKRYQVICEYWKAWYTIGKIYVINWNRCTKNSNEEKTCYLAIMLRDQVITWSWNIICCWKMCGEKINISWRTKDNYVSNASTNHILQIKKIT